MKDNQAHSIDDEDYDYDYSDDFENHDDWYIARRPLMTKSPSNAEPASGSIRDNQAHSIDGIMSSYKSPAFYCWSSPVMLGKR